MRGVERRGQVHTCLAGGRQLRPCHAAAVCAVAQQRVCASAARVCPRRVYIGAAPRALRSSGTLSVVGARRRGHQCALEHLWE